MPDSVLIISAVSPVPVDNGKRLILHGLLGYFVDRLGPENVHYAFLGSPGEARPNFPGIAHRLSRPGSGAQLLTLVRRFATDRSCSAQEALLGSQRLRGEIQTLVAWLRPTIEIYDTIRIGQHAPSEPRSRRRVLYLDDLFSMRYQTMLDFAGGGVAISVDPLGEFAVNVPKPLRALIKRPAVYLPVLRMERDRIKRREIQMVKEFDTSLLVNPREAKILRSRSGIDRIRAINGLLPAVKRMDRIPSTPPELVFLGRLNIPHNDDAICSFLAISMPGLKKLMPGVIVRVIGRGASPRLLRLAEEYPETVRLEGYVAELESVFAHATAALAPLRFGSGIKIKVLDALARGLPVIATTAGVDGLPVSCEGGDGCIVDDDFARWPTLLAEMAEAMRNRELSKAAAAFFERTYAREVVMAEYDDLFFGDADSGEAREDDSAVDASWRTQGGGSGSSARISRTFTQQEVCDK